MEEYQRLIEEADRQLTVADHMLLVTFPVVQDPKLLVSILNDIYEGMMSAVSSLLSYERLYKRIPNYPSDFFGKINLFQARAERRYRIDMSYIDLLKDIHEVIALHKKSPVEFRRKDAFVICSDSYRLCTITMMQLREHLSKAKLFIGEIHHMVEKHERISR